MKVVIAIDSFKGSLSSMQAGNAACSGIKRVCDADVVVKPLADGGEGTKDLDPWNATTRGVGEMILDAVKRGCREFIIGIGGSATTEGGMGMLKALGYEFLDAQGNPVREGVMDLDQITSIHGENVPEELRECHFQIACDVKNPLCGENGAVYVYGSQKGVKDEEKQLMDGKMLHFAQKTTEHFGRDNSLKEGAGAAGGLGHAFLSYLPNAELKSGIEIVLGAIGLAKEVKDADIVVTGEGRLDSQTAMGKVPVGVAHLAKQYHAKVIAFAGGVTEDAGKCNEEGIDAFFPIVRGVTTLDEAMAAENAMRNMELTVEQVFRLLKK